MYTLHTSTDLFMCIHTWVQTLPMLTYTDLCVHTPYTSTYILHIYECIHTCTLRGRNTEQFQLLVPYCIEERSRWWFERKCGWSWGLLWLRVSLHQGSRSCFYLQRVQTCLGLHVSPIYAAKETEAQWTSKERQDHNSVVALCSGDSLLHVSAWQGHRVPIYQVKHHSRGVRMISSLEGVDI